MENVNGDLLAEKLDTLIQLVSIAMTDKKPQKEQIRLLTRAGLKPLRIAAILGTTRNSVSVALASMRTAKKRPSRKGHPHA